MESTVIDPVKKYFPYDEYRPHQRETILRILKAYENGKKHVLLQSPVGSGKSVIAMAVANIMKTAYYITTQNILLSQLCRDFNPLGVIDLKGRNNYPCWLIREFLKSDPTAMCDKGLCVKKNRSKLKKCEGKCAYQNRLEAAAAAPTTIFNFSSFLFQRYMANRFQENRNLLIVDEAHNIGPQIMNFVEVTIKGQDFGIKLPEFEETSEYMAFFESVDLRSTISENLGRLKNELDRLCGGDDYSDIPGAQDMIDEYDKWKSLASKYWRLEDYTKNVECVAEYEKKSNSVAIKPLMPNYHTPKLLMNCANKTLLMSGTILNPKIYCKDVGLNYRDVEFIDIPHTFPVENRLIHLNYAGSMKRANRETTMPKMIQKIEELMDKHEGQRGIIHCQSFQNMRDILDGVNEKNRKRFTHQDDYKDRDELLKIHEMKEDSVIIAPAFHEGLDLKGSLSFWQCIVKIAYPSPVGSKQLKIRMERDWSYYLWLTATKMLQSCGRSIRSDTDYATTYILDSDFDRFFQMADNINLLPDWFVESIRIS